jgi:FixJ family two-component response regulator
MIVNNEPTVFVVDPDGRTREAVCDLADMMNLRREAYPSGREFLDAYAPSRPGCVVLEVRIPGINGLEIQERLNAQGATSPVVFLTAQAGVSLAVRAMRAGAVHFLEKPFREPELWDAIQEAIRLDTRRRSAQAERNRLEGHLEQLTSTERELLAVIAEGKPKKTTASSLRVSVRTIELRQKRLMEKLGFDSSMELLRFALLTCDGHASTEH